MGVKLQQHSFNKGGRDDFDIPSESNYYMFRQQRTCEFEGEKIIVAFRSFSFCDRGSQYSMKKSLGSVREVILHASLSRRSSSRGNKISVRFFPPHNNNNLRMNRSISYSYMKVTIDHRSSIIPFSSSSPTSTSPLSSSLSSSSYNNNYIHKKKKKRRVTHLKIPSSPLSSSSSSSSSHIKSCTPRTNICRKHNPTTSPLPLLSPASKISYHHAALRVQKIYKSFRTRRRLADCAVIADCAVGPKWWNLFDSMDLCKVNSLSAVLDIERHRPRSSRWKKAIARAAKVGKGLSRAERARKLALQHWLEAIDPRHRYGHNLQFYYVKWLNCPSEQPFFYWLDIGDGREVSLEKCTRFKLQQQCIKYLGPVEREAYEVAIEEGKLYYKQSKQLLDTVGGPEEVKWIFVLSASKVLYVGKKIRGTFQHSSFLAGGATLSAGRLVVEKGILKAVWPHSGHYLPTEENFQEFMSFLKQYKVDLTIVQRPTTSEVEDSTSRRGKSGLGSSGDNNGKVGDGKGSDASRDRRRSKSRRMRELQSKMASIEIPKREDTLELFKMEEEEQQAEKINQNNSSSTEEEENSSDSDEFSVSMQKLFGEYQDEGKDAAAAARKENILKKINSRKGGDLSYGLAEQLTSRRWTTGAGARIGFMKHCPPAALRIRILEEANLSPRTEAKNSNLPNIAKTNNLSCLNNHHQRGNAHRSPLVSNQMKFSHGY